MTLNGGNPVGIDKEHAYRITPVSDGGVTRLRSAGTLASTAPGVVGYPYLV